MTADQKSVVVRVAVALAVLVVGIAGWWAVMAFTAKPEPQNVRAVAPLTAAQVSATYGPSADVDAADENGVPLFGFSDGEDHTTYDPATGALTDRGPYASEAARKEAFAKSADARLAAARTANAILLAVLNPAADQSFIAALDKTAATAAEDGVPAYQPLAGYLPSKAFREQVTDVRYESFRMPMVLTVKDGKSMVSGTIQVRGTLSLAGKSRAFYFYTDYSTDGQGKLLGLAGFLLQVDGQDIRSDVLSLP